MKYSDGKTCTEMRDDLLSWGVGRPIVRTAVHAGNAAMRDLYNQVCEHFANQTTDEAGI